MRLYLNDGFVAAVKAGDDGRLSVTINQGVASGSYRVRLDEMEPNSSAVRARAEVPFNASDTIVTGSLQVQATASTIRNPGVQAQQRTPAVPFSRTKARVSVDC